MFVGFTSYHNSHYVSFHARPKYADMGGHSINWKRVVLDGKPIEESELSRLRALVQDFDEFTPAPGTTWNTRYPFGHDTFEHAIDIEYIRLYIQYLIAANSNPLKESEMEGELDRTRKRILDNITRSSCHRMKVKITTPPY